MQTQCPGCRREWKVKEKFAGRNVTCPSCSTPFQATPMAPPSIIPLATRPSGGPHCPSCGDQALLKAGGELGERCCPSCEGAWLAPAAVRRFASGTLRIDPAILFQLEPFSRGEAKRCPGCGGGMTTVQVRNVPVDLCRSCSGLWLDGGELHQVTGGRHGTKTEPPQRRARGCGEDGHACQCLEEMIVPHRRLKIRQEREWGEILLGWETANQYTVWGGGRTVAVVLEKSEGLEAALLRQFLGSHRPLDIQVTDIGERQGLLRCKRPFFWFFSDMEVRTAHRNRLLGRVRRRFNILYRWYDLHDERGRLFATIRSPLLRFWTFRIHDAAGNPRGLIAKRWSGFFQEAVSDADNFGIDFGTHDWTLSQRCVLFAAALSIDFDFFENNDRR